MKLIPFNHPMFNQTADGKGEPYVHQIRGAENLVGPPFEILSDKAVKDYEKKDGTCGRSSKSYDTGIFLSGDHCGEDEYLS